MFSQQFDNRQQMSHQQDDEEGSSIHLPSIHTFIQNSTSNNSTTSHQQPHHSYPSPHYPFSSPFLSASNVSNSSRPRSQDSLMSGLSNFTNHHQQQQQHSNNLSPSFQYHQTQFSNNHHHQIHQHHDYSNNNNNQMEDESPTLSFSNNVSNNNLILSNNSHQTSPTPNSNSPPIQQHQQHQHRTQRSNSGMNLNNQLNRKAVITPSGINLPPNMQEQQQFTMNNRSHHLWNNGHIINTANTISSNTNHHNHQNNNTNHHHNTQPPPQHTQPQYYNSSSTASTTASSSLYGGAGRNTTSNSSTSTYQVHNHHHEQQQHLIGGGMINNNNGGAGHGSGGGYHNVDQQQSFYHNHSSGGVGNVVVHHQPLNSHVLLNNPQQQPPVTQTNYYNQQQQQQQQQMVGSRPVPVPVVSNNASPQFSGMVVVGQNSTSSNSAMSTTGTSTLSINASNSNSSHSNGGGGMVAPNQFGISPLPWDNNSKTIRSFSNFQPKPPKKSKSSVKQCENPKCNATDTPLWRKGYFVEGGRRANLCNACGLHYRKGHFCKFCNEIYRDVNELVSTEPWILCCACERYMHRKCVQGAGIALPKSQSHQHISQAANDQFYCDECGGGKASAAAAAAQANNSNIDIAATAINNTTINEKESDKMIDETSFETSPILNAIANNSTSPPKTSGSRPLSFQAPPSTQQVKVVTRPFTVSADRENVVSLLMRHNETNVMGMMNAPNPFVNNATSIEEENNENSSNNGLTSFYNLKNRPLPPIPSNNGKAFSEEATIPVNSTTTSPQNMGEGNTLPSINFLLTPPKD